MSDLLPPTKANFVIVYRKTLLELYAWARDDAAKLDKFMLSVSHTLYGRQNTFNRSGAAYEATLKALGLPKAIALKALWALPDGNRHEI